MFEMVRAVPVDPPRLVWIRQVGNGTEVAVPGLLHSWRRTRRKPRWEGQVTMYDQHGRRAWHGWMNAHDLAPWDAIELR